ncbi:MAG: hypothetical protein ACI867_000050 [Glaciecola sp.]|jgi:hypothetical protein
MSDSAYTLISEVSRALMQDSPDFAGSPRAQVRADLVHADPVMLRDEPAQIVIEVTNLGRVIRAFDVELLGIDPDRVTFDPERLELFPAERQTVTATVNMPLDHPAGTQHLAVQVVEVGTSSSSPAVVEFQVEVEGRAGLSLSAEPATLEMGSAGVFILHLVNTGNTELALDLSAQDAERLVAVTFEPVTPVLQPGQRAVVTASAKGPRPWFGMPAVRVLDVEATASGVTAISAVALLQRPRISRRLIALLGLLMVVTLFAYVISTSFGRVADLTEQNQALVQQGLGFKDQAGARVDPSTMSGLVASSTGEGIDGATVRLFDEGNVLVPVYTTVTNDSGAFSLASVADGTYLLQAEAAGFGVIWHEGAATFEGATAIEVVDQMQLTGLELILTGQPGSVEGVVTGKDVEGAQVAVRIPAAAVQGSTLGPVAAVVAAIEIDATGLFILPDLATPATYELAVFKEGFATEVRTITLKAGEQRGSLQILLRAGIGVIGGQVVDEAGEPIIGAEIRASDGVSELLTRSYDVPGQQSRPTLGTERSGGFALRDLSTPGTYTITVSAPGFFSETKTISLQSEEQKNNQLVRLSRNSGRLQGHVTDGRGEPLGAVTITVTGPDLERTTRSLTIGDTGLWMIPALPVPGTYTVSLSLEGHVTTALTVQLGPGAQANKMDVDAVLVRSTARVEGLVEDSQGARLAGVQITLEASDVLRETRTSDADRSLGDENPLGKYVFDRLPPGAYTLTYRRVGSTPQTIHVNLVAGDQRILESVVLEKQATVKGVLFRNRQPSAGAGVLIYRARDYPEGLVASTVTADDGSFLVTGLDAPESYVIDFHIPAEGEVAGSEKIFLNPGQDGDLGRVQL